MTDGPQQAPLAQTLNELLRGAWITQAIHVASRLRLADLVAERPRPVAELAAACGAHPGALARLVRALASYGLFDQDSEGRVVLTPLAELLRADVPGSQRAYANFIGASWHRQAWTHLEHAVRTGEPAFEHAFGKQLFDYFRDDPAAAEVFHDAMTGVSGQNAAAVAAAYSFDGIRTLVDVGGGHGFLLATILRAHPHLRGVLYDRPEVVAGAGPVLDAAGVGDRCDIAAGDFFRSVPRGGDAYIMKAIIHDWDDDRCATILGHCREAMGPRGVLLIVDCVVPGGHEGAFAKILDLEMLVMTHHGRERTEAEFRALLARVGFVLTRVVPTGAPQSVVEGRPA